MRLTSRTSPLSGQQMILARSLRLSSNSIGGELTFMPKQQKDSLLNSPPENIVIAVKSTRRGRHEISRQKQLIIFRFLGTVNQ